MKVCFGCRKGFKDKNICPHCGQTLSTINSKPPPSRNRGAWRTLKKKHKRK